MSPSESVVPAANAKIEVTGAVNLGTQLELRQRVQRRANPGLRMSAGLPTDGSLLAVDVNPLMGAPGAVRAEQLCWEFGATQTPMDIQNKGLTESYMIFGKPGSGKTYLHKFPLPRGMFWPSADGLVASCHQEGSSRNRLELDQRMGRHCRPRGQCVA
jgi:hypothetical protein